MFSYFAKKCSYVTVHRLESVGIPLKFKVVIARPKVMQALYDVEEAYPNIGRSML
jgi:hypothetical protein